MAWWSIVLMNAAARRSCSMYSIACTLQSHSCFQTVWFTAVLSRVFCPTFVESDQKDPYKNPSRYEYVARHPASNAMHKKKQKHEKEKRENWNTKHWSLSTYDKRISWCSKFLTRRAGIVFFAHNFRLSTVGVDGAECNHRDTRT